VAADEHSHEKGVIGGDGGGCGGEGGGGGDGGAGGGAGLYVAATPELVSIQPRYEETRV